VQKYRDDIKLFSTDSSLKTDVSLDEIKTTNVNILLNRVRIKKKNYFEQLFCRFFKLLFVFILIFYLNLKNYKYTNYKTKQKKIAFSK